MNWYVRCLLFEFLLNYCESSRSILSKSKRKSTYQRLNQLKLKSQKKRPEARHRIKSYQKRIIRFNQILLKFFLRNCLENQIPFKHMTNMSMIRINWSLRYNVIYQPCSFSPKQNNGALKKNTNPVGFKKGQPCGVSGTAQQLCIVILGLSYRQRLERCCVRPEL